MSDMSIPEDTQADLVNHLSNDIDTYQAQLGTINALIKRQEAQLQATKDRAAYIQQQLDTAQQALAKARK